MSNVWEKHCIDMRKHLAQDDWSDFTKWPTVRGTMFVGEAPHIKGQFEELMKNSALWKSVLQEVDAGKPSRLSYAPWTSGQMVRIGYYLSLWGVDYSSLESIFEFGPGYGTAALLARRLGFGGDYFMHDLPEFERLQRYYLDAVGVEATHVDMTDRDVDLFIAICSISEAPLNVRTDVLQSIDAKSYLFVYGPGIWAGVNNKEFFQGFMDYRDDLYWQTYPDPHYTNLSYSVGR